MYQDNISNIFNTFEHRTGKRLRSQFEANRVVSTGIGVPILAVRLSGPAIKSEILEMNYPNVHLVVVERNQERLALLSNIASETRSHAIVETRLDDFHTAAQHLVTQPDFKAPVVWLDADYTRTLRCLMKDEDFVENWEDLINTMSHTPLDSLFITQTFSRRRGHDDEHVRWFNEAFPELLTDYGYDFLPDQLDYGCPRHGEGYMTTCFYECWRDHESGTTK